MSSFKHTWSGEPLKMTLEDPLLPPARLAEDVLGKGTGCIHLRIQGKSFVDPVDACIALCDSHPGYPMLDGDPEVIMSWRASIDGEWPWLKAYGINGIQPRDMSPSFETAIVPFTRAWSDTVTRAWRVSLLRELLRLRNGLLSYDVNIDGYMKMYGLGDQDYLVIDGPWAERAARALVTKLKAEWLMTPEGFLESGSKKKKRT